MFHEFCDFRSKGSSLSFITREDWKQAQNLIYILEEANQVILVLTKLKIEFHTSF
jgi:hypothetical protein